MEKRKISIIGGGVAGLSAGISLLSNGNENIEVSCYERSYKGREKCCGGLITRHGVMKLKELLNEQKVEKCLLSKIKRFDIYENYKKVIEGELEEDNEICIFDRQKVDLALAERFIELGGSYHQCHIVDFEEMVKMTETNEKVINASGARKNEQKCGFGIEYELIKRDVQDTKIWWDERDARIEIYFGVIKNGYGWVFPIGDKVRIGLATFDNRIETNTVCELAEQFMKQVKKYNEFETEHCRKGAFIPSCIDKHKRINKEDKIIWLGDRAGYIDYITGEGNSFSLEMGSCVGEIIRDDYKPSIATERYNICANIVASSYRLSKWFYKDWFRKLIWKICNLKKMADKDFVGKVYDELINRKVHCYNFTGLMRVLRECNNR